MSAALVTYVFELPEGLDRATAAMERALGADDLPAWAVADERFHQLLTERCGNRRLARIAGTVMDQAHRSRLLTLRLRPSPIAAAAEHRAITTAIRGGDADAAELAARSRNLCNAAGLGYGGSA